MIKDFVVFDDYVEYSGPFELRELYILIDKYFKDRHYDKNEKKHFEKNSEEGRLIELLMVPNKTVSEYIKMNIEILIEIKNIQDITINVNDKKKTIQQGDVSIRFRSFILKDYAGSWEKPWLMFLRSLIDKYIYKTHIGQFGDELIEDTERLKFQIKSFLNLHNRR